MAIRNKKYIVRLDQEERESLRKLVRAGKAAARKISRARMLLKADAGTGGPGWTDQRIAETLEVGVRTVENLRRCCVEEGLERPLWISPDLIVPGSGSWMAWVKPSWWRCPAANHRRGVRGGRWNFWAMRWWR